jgi:hypothetical protein
MMRRTILVLFVLGACDKGSAPAAEGKSDAKAESKADVKADAKAEAKADAKIDAKADAKPAGERFVTADQLVDVPKPSGTGWECLEQTAPDPKTTLAKCRHTDRAQFFFLIAKDYVVPADQKKTAEQLANEVFPATYAKLFASHTIDTTKSVEYAGRKGHELAVSAKHAQIGDIQKRELVFVEGDHVFVLSAEGKPDVFAANQAAIDAWFSTTRFRNAPGPS